MKYLASYCFSLYTFLFASGALAEDALQLAALEPSSAHARAIWDELDPAKLELRSSSALVMDATGNILYAKQEDEPRPIASITKLMTAMVILDSQLSLSEHVTITRADRDNLKHTGSRLHFGTTLSREQLLKLMLMASENRAALALARTYPGGRNAFAEAMNEKAQALGMNNSHFVEAAGLDPRNIASARDVATMVRAAHSYRLIRTVTTTSIASVKPVAGMGTLRFGNTNRLLRDEHWDIRLSKTGFINEAGRCLAMGAAIADEALVIVLLNAAGKLTPYGDSNRIRHWIERGLEAASYRHVAASGPS